MELRRYQVDREMVVVDFDEKKVTVKRRVVLDATDSWQALQIALRRLGDPPGLLMSVSDVAEVA